MDEHYGLYSGWIKLDGFKPAGAAGAACRSNLKLGIRLSICSKTGESQEMFVGIVVQYIALRVSLRTSKRRQSVSITNINHLSSFREIIVDCSENLMEYTGRMWPKRTVPKCCRQRQI